MHKAVLIFFYIHTIQWTFTVDIACTQLSAIPQCITSHFTDANSCTPVNMTINLSLQSKGVLNIGVPSDTARIRWITAPERSKMTLWCWKKHLLETNKISVIPLPFTKECGIQYVSAVKDNKKTKTEHRRQSHSSFLPSSSSVVV